MWLTLNHQLPQGELPIARCTVERLMRELGLAGAVRGKVKRTTIRDPRSPKPRDLVNRRFAPLAPDRLWVADFTYVSTWSGWCYTAFVIDAYARRIVGWSVSTSMTSRFVVDAVEQAIWTRRRDGRDLTGLIAHHDHGVQYMSVAYSERLDAAGIKPSTGAVGSSYDNALAESVNGLYKTELIKPRRPWKGLDDLEIATAGWVDWFNHRRPFEYCNDLTPVEAEQARTTLTTRAQHRLESQTRKSPDSPGRFIAGVTSVVGTSIGLIVPGWIAAYAGLVIVGLVLGPVFPLAIDVAAERTPTAVSVAAAAVSAVGYLAYLGGPPAIGFVAHTAGLPLTIALVGSVCGAALAAAASGISRAVATTDDVSCTLPNLSERTHQ